jgi:hypothetical protein
MFIVAGACAGEGSSILYTFDPSGPVRRDVPNAVSPKGLVVLENPVAGGGGGKRKCEEDPEVKPAPMNDRSVRCGCDGRSVAVARCRAMARSDDLQELSVQSLKVSLLLWGEGSGCGDICVAAGSRSN